MRSATRTSLAVVVLAVVLVIVLLLTLSTCARSCVSVSERRRAAETKRVEERSEEDEDTEVDADRPEESDPCPEDEIDEDAPTGVTGDVVRIPLEIPEDIPTREAVMINDDKDSLPRTDEQGEVAVYLYDDPDEEELNLIVESDWIATEVWWLEPDGEWVPSPSAFCLTEEGSDKENIEFLMPPDTSEWGDEIVVGFSPVR